MEGVAAVLGRLLPNIGGPGNKVRYLYTQFIKPMTLYGSSIWARHIRNDGFRILRRIQSTMAIRITRAYRSVSHDVAFALPGMTSLRNTADAYTEINERIGVLRSTSVHITKSMAAHMRS